MQNQMTHSPEAVCKNVAAYDAAIHCSLQLAKTCTMPGYETYLPSEANLKQAQNVMAYIHAEECLEEEITECGEATVEIHKQLNQLNAPVICQGGSSIGKK
ncbi:hypothetical protein PoB_004066700 [Plakobranchus ocellatus]|uniref:Uncharacterized protein n=1 Tax=Plakobranchus ocellatus TaxID=259542 RepID=A0AAV4B4W6_9GAST|nr:hypothetical protein PoB_004066700 [Plakobranchus ocellatus]